jgi:hypothetical protein
VKNEVSGNDLRDTRQVQQRESIEIQCKWIQLRAVVAHGLPSNTSRLKCTTKSTIPTLAPNDIWAITNWLGLCRLGHVRLGRHRCWATESKAGYWSGEDARTSVGRTTSTGRNKPLLGMTRFSKAYKGYTRRMKGDGDGMRSTVRGNVHQSEDDGWCIQRICFRMYCSP